MTAFKHAPIAFVLVLTSMLLLNRAASGDELIVRVDKIKEAGDIHIAIYDNAEAFEADRAE